MLQLGSSKLFHPVLPAAYVFALEEAKVALENHIKTLQLPESSTPLIHLLQVPVCGGVGCLQCGGWEPFYPNGRPAARSSSPAPSSLVNSPPPRGIMTLGTKITCSFHQRLGLTFSRLTWQRGVQWTGEDLQHRFWWATLEEDTREFVNACPVCNQHKPCHQAPAGLL